MDYGKQKVVTNTGDKLVQQVESNMKEQELKRKRVEISNKMQQLAEATANAIMEYGEQHYLSQTLMQFLDIAVQMEDAIKVIEGFNIASGYIFGLLDFVNESLNYNNLMFVQSNKSKSGFFSQMKEGMMRRRAMANMRGSIKRMVDSIKNVSTFSMTLANEMKKMTKQLSDDMKKKQAKDGTDKTGGYTGSEKALKLVQSYMGNNQNVGDNNNGGSNNPFKGSGNGNNPGGKVTDSGVDDII